MGMIKYKSCRHVLAAGSGLATSLQQPSSSTSVCVVCGGTVVRRDCSLKIREARMETRQEVIADTCLIYVPRGVGQSRTDCEYQWRGGQRTEERMPLLRR
ncbi:hypothetical protein KQX54_006707 [Cotesia glomerata]|uniref:Uncharacterized protein n=1 Tax=Cotesia glomerata TaxID=32391 RepID=A0AAV7IU13_COTGL|nr:hypothetical protein KQX54_006707 [Cotesia glomerata]